MAFLSTDYLEFYFYINYVHNIVQDEKGNAS